jgi:hypothetical protein
VREADHLLQDYELDEKRLTWKQVAMEVSADVVGRTMHNILRAALDYEKCLVCVKGWLVNSPMNRRMKYADVMLVKYSDQEQWKRVRFSDEVHFDYDPEEKLHIIRQSDTRYRWDCIQHRDSSAEKNRKRMYCWTAIEYNFKSDIIFYDVLDNSNDKMTHQIYINFILELVVKSWLKRENDFVLEKNDDSGHDTNKTRNAIKKWKENHELKHYFNCASSSDLASIENCWQSTKQHIHKFSHWDNATLMKLIRERWDRVSQDFINEKVLKSR